MGILPQIYIEGLENTPGRTVYASLNAAGGKPTGSPATAYSFGGAAWDNWYLKHQFALNREGLNKLAGNAAGYAPIAKARMQGALAEDESYWHGWYSRNGGSVTLLGDHFSSDSDAPAIVKIGLLATLLTLLMRATAAKNRSLMEKATQRHP